ncbi:SRR1-like protein [Aethina tumida]|uniref:SRR1-like protein n=1 Tax=Aethina tumida TaxID=116153 RepID=UPI00214963DD|nr:SRR1-like protein [Aethina tumida]
MYELDKTWRIEEAKIELLSTDFYDSISASLKEGLTALSNCTISEIICLGLGRIGECLIPRFQFALLLCLYDIYKVKISVFDPVFTDEEKCILKHFNCNILTENLEGKYKVKDKYILFYLPHCPKQLTNNLLWANWGLNLTYCVIISNSFNTIIENTSKRELRESGQYISNIIPYTLELAIINSFKYYEVFNDLAIHIFPFEKLNIISDDIWNFTNEPKYSDADIEFIRNCVEENLKLT